MLALSAGAQVGHNADSNRTDLLRGSNGGSHGLAEGVGGGGVLAGDEAAIDHNAVLEYRSFLCWASQQFTLHPGDVFLLGTPDYRPSGDESGAVLRPGRTVKVEITGVGELMTPVI